MLKPYIEPDDVDDDVDDDNSPVKKCCRYIENRPGQFNYKDALETGLPIGSGEIKSSHRYILQNRLKIAGSWWKKDNAQKMIALRLLRANTEWKCYWEKQQAT